MHDLNLPGDRFDDQPSKFYREEVCVAGDEDEMWFECPNCHSLGGGFDVGSITPRGSMIRSVFTANQRWRACRARPVFEVGEDLCEFCVE